MNWLKAQNLPIQLDLKKYCTTYFQGERFIRCYRFDLLFCSAINCDKISAMCLSFCLAGLDTDRSLALCQRSIHIIRSISFPYHIPILGLLKEIE